jgi:hypothetical protein
MRAGFTGPPTITRVASSMKSACETRAPMQPRDGRGARKGNRSAVQCGGGRVSGCHLSCRAVRLPCGYLASVSRPEDACDGWLTLSVFETKGKVREARRLHSITLIRLSLERNWMSNGPDICNRSAILNVTCLTRLRNREPRERAGESAACGRARETQSAVEQRTRLRRSRRRKHEFANAQRNRCKACCSIYLTVSQ